MNKLTFYLRPLPHPSRRNCWEAIKNQPDGMVVTIQDETRSMEQNRYMWPLLQLWAKHQTACVNGEQIHVSKEAWKMIHLADFRKDFGENLTMCFTPGGVLVPLGLETHLMAKKEFTEFLGYLLAETHKKGMDLPTRLADGYGEYLGRCA